MLEQGTAGNRLCPICGTWTPVDCTHVCNPNAHPMGEAQRALLFPQPERRPYVCPVCLGKGHVDRGFYGTTRDNWERGGTDIERCRSCHGSGYVVV